MGSLLLFIHNDILFSFQDVSYLGRKAMPWFHSFNGLLSLLTWLFYFLIIKVLSLHVWLMQWLIDTKECLVKSNSICFTSDKTKVALLLQLQLNFLSIMSFLPVQDSLVSATSTAWNCGHFFHKFLNTFDFCQNNLKQYLCDEYRHILFYSTWLLGMIDYNPK